jgi:peptide/nickel transport system substrate-binding protein
MIWTGSEYGAAVERGTIAYAYDPRRSEQLMQEAGFARGADGYFANAEGRFTAEVKTNQGADNVSELAALASMWRQAGFDMQDAVLPAAQAQDNQVRSLFPSLYTNNINMGEPTLIGLNTDSIPRPENRWNGTNRGGWSNEGYDRLVETFNRTLDRSERVEIVAELLRIFTTELPAISLFHRSQPLAYVPALRGPAPAAPESSQVWNIHTWEFTR